MQDISLAVKVDKRQVKDLSKLVGRVEKQVGSLNKIKINLDATKASRTLKQLAEDADKAAASLVNVATGATKGGEQLSNSLGRLAKQQARIRSSFLATNDPIRQQQVGVGLLAAQYKQLRVEGRALAFAGADIFGQTLTDSGGVGDLSKRLKELKALPETFAGTGQALKEIDFLLNNAVADSEQFKMLIEAQNAALARQKRIRESIAFVTEVQRRATAPMPADPFRTKVPLLPAAGQTSGTFSIQQREKAIQQQTLNLTKKKLSIEKFISKENTNQAKTTRKAAKERLENIRKIRRQRQGAKLNETLLGAGFPLLFGGGPGAVGGSILGGALGAPFGASFGGQIFGSAIGQQFEQAIQQATEIGNAISTLNLDALEQSGIRVNAQLRLQINALREVGDFSRAEIALKEEAANQTGALFDVTTDVANAYNILGAAGTKFGATLSTTLGILGVIVAVPLAGILDGLADTLGLVNSIFSVIGETSKRVVLLLENLPGMERVFQNIEKAIEGTNKQLDESVVKARQLTGDKGREFIVAERNLRIESQKTAGLTAQAKINNNNLDLKNKIANLDDQERAELRKLNGQTTVQNFADMTAAKNITKQTFEARRNRERLLVDRRNENILAAEVLKTDKEKEKTQEQFERKVNRQIKGAESAYNSANKTLDRYNARLADRVAFEREYDELINQGILPAEAKRVVELKKEALQVQRQFEAEVGILDTKIKQIEASALEGELTDDQIERLKKLNEEKARLEGKAVDAQNQGADAAKPRTDAERIRAQIKVIQGEINTLMDPVSQLISLADSLGNSFSESFRGIVDGSMSAQQALANLFQRTADHFLDMAAQMIAAQIKMQLLNIGLNFFGGGVGRVPTQVPQMTKNAIVTPTGFSGQFGGFAANGGPVTGGNSYIVGERGPELFVPGAKGNIVPNHAMGGGANVTVNVDASGSSVEGDGDQAAQLGKMLGAAVQAELVKQKRPGGLLAS